jgi:hypothetical protein
MGRGVARMREEYEVQTTGGGGVGGGGEHGQQKTEDV